MRLPDRFPLVVALTLFISLYCCGCGGGGGGNTYYDTTLTAMISPATLTLGNTATITGTLIAAGGSPVNGMLISFTVSNGDIIASAVTNTSGAFTTTYTPSKAGSVTIIAHYAGTS